MIRLNCTLTVSQENRAKAIELCKELVEASLKDAGVISYDIFASETRPSSLLIFETWQDQPSLDAHSASKHFTTLVPQIQALGEMTIEAFNF